MSELHFAIMALVLGAIFLVAAALSYRFGDDKRDVGFILGSGGVFGALALILFSVARA